MADRFFPNEMPDYIPETPSVESAAVAASDSLTKLLHLPYRTLSKGLKKAALDLKDAVVKETWVGKGKRVGDYTLYTGALGTAFLLFKAYQVTGDKNDLALCSDIIEACNSASRGSGRVTFICGRAGVCALGAVVAHHKGDQQLCHQYLAQFKEIKLSKDLPDELLYGRAGFLWASSFLNKILAKRQFLPPECGNYPSSEGSETDRLVHWCHGAPGVALTLAKAAKVFGSEEFLQAAIDAGEVVWNRGLLKRVGVCHGISGNAYVFLSLYQLTGKPEFLYRAKAFACFLHDRAQTLISEGIMHGGDRPYSLFEGIGGMAYLFLDMTEPSQARFPAYV
ncbi:UNVERIFIED_CONTAM: LanC-like protein GCR2 [Sesamum angustifolium]|uniref:LanC-like protein GCR2 n=1 Tax=Sesamum angustifolium TaxID=2727405 RepID=A0AAW2INT1_9LAMI